MSANSTRNITLISILFSVFVAAAVYYVSQKNIAVADEIVFELPTQQGLVKSKDFLGKNVYLFFGFTKCPHICPTTVGTFKNFLKDHSDSVAIFVSVDLKRDTLPVLAGYTKGISDRFFAGTYPNDEQLSKLTQKFNAAYSVTYNDKDPTAPPLVDHSSLIYVINKKGEWVDQLPYNVSVDALTAHSVQIDSKSPMSAPHRQLKLNEIAGENKDCDLALKTCSLPGLEVSFSAKPVILTDLLLNLKVTNPELGTPVSADFTGKEINMGYLRPSFKSTETNQYEAKINLPFCETPTMEWVLKVLVKPKPEIDTLKEYIFHFTTTQSL